MSSLSGGPMRPEFLSAALLAAPNANEYYAKLGFEHNQRPWLLRGSWPVTGQDSTGLRSA